MSEPGTLPLPELGLSAEEAANRFGRLQQKLVPLWRSIRAFNQEEQTIVVVPSITAEFDIKGAEMQAYEERFLFLLLLLRQPRARLIYVTSQSILPSTVDYYLGLLPGVIASHARSRLSDSFFLRIDFLRRLLPIGLPTESNGLASKA